MKKKRAELKHPRKSTNKQDHLDENRYIDSWGFLKIPGIKEDDNKYLKILEEKSTKKEESQPISEEGNRRHYKEDSFMKVTKKNRRDYLDDYDDNWEYPYHDHCDDDRDKDKDKDCCFPRHPKHPKYPKHPKRPKKAKPKAVLVKCGTNPQPAIFDTTQRNFARAALGIQAGNYPGYLPGLGVQTFVLDRVTVDTSCQCDPLVKIEFSSIIHYDIVPNQRSFRLELLFELVRVCGDDKAVVQQWTYLKDFELQAGDQKLNTYTVSEPFTVTHCDQPCPDCCQYIMKVTALDINDESPEPDFSKVMVLKPNISAIAQDNCNCCDGY